MPLPPLAAPSGRLLPIAAALPNLLPPPPNFPRPSLSLFSYRGLFAVRIMPDLCALLWRQGHRTKRQG
jgi:hypothetical protein